MLAETPGEIGTVRSEILEGVRSFPAPPYVLFFRYSNGEVQVARVLHERQDVRRHLGFLTGRFEVPDNFDAPLPEDVLADFEGGADEPDR